MSNEKVSQLPGVSSALATDVIYAIQGGISVQETLSQVLELGLSFDTLYYAGDPNGNLAGQTFQKCWDTTNKVFWVCTTTGSATTAVWETAYGTLTDGQVIIGYTGNAPQRAQLTAGANISIMNGPGSITISGSSPTPFMWVEVTTTSQAMSPNVGYVANNAALVTLTLPTTAAFGDQIGFCGKGAGLFKIAQNSGQQIHMGANSTTVGTGGSVTTLAQHNSFTLVCTTNNTTWTLLGASQGNQTVV